MGVSIGWPLGGWTANIVVSVGVVTVLLCFVYRWALPRPLPGIPYNVHAAQSIYGDIPSLMRHMSTSKEVYPWMYSQNVQLNSPIIQLFMKPLSKPWVIIADYRETLDILTRRTKQFDRSPYFGDIFHGVMPENHITMSSTDERFAAHKRLIQGSMAPPFLHSVLAPQIYAATETLVKYWKEKSRLAVGHPFDIRDDVIEALMDAISASTFGLPQSDGALTAQLRHVRDLDRLQEMPTNKADPVDCPRASRPPLIEAFMTLTQSMIACVESPVPRVHHWCLRQLPYMRKARSLKENMIATQLDQAMRRFIGPKPEQVSTCVLDDILRRELKMAEKESRKLAYKSRTIVDELYGFVTGGVDTTGSTTMWALKFISENQSAQRQLRTSLRNAFPAATAERRQPTAEEITEARIPYLDAFMEELFRMAATIPAHVRTTTEDTTILGHFVPKGTEIFLAINGPGFSSPPFAVDETTRSETSRSMKDASRSWDLTDMNLFRPERWLVTDAQGNELVDLTAAPQMLFSLGPRACFGRKLGYLNIRVLLVLLVWHFEFLELPKELISDDGIERFTRQPRLTYVRIGESRW